MNILDRVTKKAAIAARKSAENVAVRNSTLYCRIWLGQEKVPRALLEPEVKGR